MYSNVFITYESIEFGTAVARRLKANRTKVEFNSINWVRHGSSKMFEMGLRVYRSGPHTLTKIFREYPSWQLHGQVLSTRGEGEVLGSIFAGYVPLASLNPYPIIVYSVASYTPHVSHFWANIPQVPSCRNLAYSNCARDTSGSQNHGVLSVFLRNALGSPFRLRFRMLQLKTEETPVFLVCK